MNVIIPKEPFVLLQAARSLAGKATKIDAFVKMQSHKNANTVTSSAAATANLRFQKHFGVKQSKLNFRYCSKTLNVHGSNPLQLDGKIQFEQEKNLSVVPGNFKLEKILGKSGCL